ncbi:MAG: MoxR family ATPase [Deltaproteobacteria bacterium]|jgi:MoxR-like ATPase|nr:MoxR family ATPase [Deltaproteobacteria bacterium]
MTDLSSSSPRTSPAAQHPVQRARATLHAEVGKHYVGSRDTVDLLLVALLARGHILLEGVPGIAKTTLVKTFTETLGCAFSRIQFTPDLLPADITGTYVLNLRDQTFTLRRGPVFANIVLADEINRAPAKTQSALLEAMQESQVTIEGETHRLPSPFMVLATQNPIEQEGVYVLPEAQVDRFLFRVLLGYPTFDEERQVLATWNRTPPPVGVVLSPELIESAARAVEEIHIAPTLIDWIVRVVQATRVHPSVRLGASPRASLALLRTSKARAFLHGRDMVIPDDIKELARYVLNHRILLNPEAELDQVRVDEVVSECFQQTPYARES